MVSAFKSEEGEKTRDVITTCRIGVDFEVHVKAMVNYMVSSLMQGLTEG